MSGAPQLALCSADKSWSVVDAKTRVRRLHGEDTHTDYIWCIAWSPDGTELALCSSDKSWSVVDAKTGERRLHGEDTHTDYIYCIAWKPDSAKQQDPEERKRQQQALVERAGGELEFFRQLLKKSGKRTMRHSMAAIIGNGRVGKTSLIDALRGRPFDAAMRSTEGIDTC
eukprot:COSAG06_NODE_16404_length_1003_cov_1.296460_1_plen_169_part_01